MKQKAAKTWLFFFFLAVFLAAAGPVLPDTLTDKIDALFTEWDKPDSPGCALGIIKDGKFLYKRGYGMANLEYNTPITPETVFRIGSTSKQFSAACIALLEEAGKLSVDDDIRKYLPEMPSYGAPITLRHLILHTSGIRDYLTLMELAGAREDDYFTVPEAVDLICRQKELNFDPGNEYLYSNSGYFFLSAVVKKVTGQTLREFAEENIFKPLGMSNTHFHDDHTRIVKNRASGYAPKKDGGFVISMTTLDMVGDGGVFTCIDDLFLWDQNFYNNKLGKASPQWLTKILTPGKLNSGEKMDYAFGLRISDYRGLKMVSHGGAFAGYRAEMIRFPEERFSVIVLANLNSINPTRLALKAADICLEDKLKEDKSLPPEKPVFITLPEEELKRKTGAYYSKEQDRFCKILLKEGNLLINFSFMTVPLSPVSSSKFYSAKAPSELEVAFEEGLPGKPLHMRVRTQGGKAVLFEPVSFVEPAPEKLSGYEGTYFSEELQTAYRVSLKEGKLYLRHENPYKSYPKDPLEPTFEDRFLVSGIQILFSRNGKGEVASFTMNAGRVKNIRFVKL